MLCFKTLLYHNVNLSVLAAPLVTQLPVNLSGKAVEYSLGAVMQETQTVQTCPACTGIGGMTFKVSLEGSIINEIESLGSGFKAKRLIVRSRKEVIKF